jgi:ParB-like chromosome segregation protein Spo0J
MGKHTREVLAPHQVMPSLTEEEFQALKADIAENGVMVPIVKDGEGNLIDGHHRERAVRELRQEGLDVPDCPEEVRADLTTAEEKQQLAIRLNMQRRHLSRDDKSRVTKAALKRYPHWSNNRLAAMLGISDNTVRTERLYLESTSQIEKLERLEGADRRTRPRSREREEEAKLAWEKPTEIKLTRAPRAEGPVRWAHAAKTASEEEAEPQTPTAREVNEQWIKPYEEGDEERRAVTRIKRAGAVQYVVEWNNYETSSTTRNYLLEEQGYKKCKCCSGYGIVREEE